MHAHSYTIICVFYDGGRFYYFEILFIELIENVLFIWQNWHVCAFACNLLKICCACASRISMHTPRTICILNVLVKTHFNSYKYNKVSVIQLIFFYLTMKITINLVQIISVVNQRRNWLGRMKGTIE